MQRFVRGGAIGSSVVARRAASLIDGCAILRGNQVSGQEKQGTRSEAERKLHIGLDFIMLTYQPDLRSLSTKVRACYLKASRTMADLMDGVVYEPVIPTVAAFARRLVPAGPNLELNYDLHEPARPEV